MTKIDILCDVYSSGLIESGTIGKIVGTVANVADIPVASTATLGYVIVYTGESTSGFEKDRLYKCMLDGGSYSWQALNIGASITVDPEISPTSENPVQNKVIYTALQGKQNTETGKGLSTNDYTNEDKLKLASIAEGAEVNVQSDWNTVDMNDDSYIRNKPTNVSVFDNDAGYSAVSVSATGSSTTEVQYITVNSTEYKLAGGGGGGGSYTAGTGIDITNNVISTSGHVYLED